MNLTTIEPVAQITLVNIDGDPVQHDPIDPWEWPDWTDNWLYATDDEPAESFPSQALPSRTDDDDDGAGHPLKPLPPIPGRDEEGDTGEFPPAPTEPPEGWQGSASVGWAMLPPLAGGAPDDADYADYLEWSIELDDRRATEAYLAGFNEQRQDWTEVPA